MVPLIITLLRWEFVVTTMVIFFSVFIFMSALKKSTLVSTMYIRVIRGMVLRPIQVV